MKETQRRW